jgi:hypothetical protein
MEKYTALSLTEFQTTEYSDENENKDIALNSRGTLFESHSEQMLPSFKISLSPYKTNVRIKVKVKLSLC